MKNASRILSIIACVIGILWSVIGAPIVFFGSAAMAGINEAGGNHAQTAHLRDVAIGTAGALVGALVMMILGMVFSSVGNNENAGRTKTLVMGTLLLFSGLLATVLHSYVAGPIYVFCGLLTVLAGAFITHCDS